MNFSTIIIFLKPQCVYSRDYTVFIEMFYNLDIFYVAMVFEI